MPRPIATVGPLLLLVLGGGCATTASSQPAALPPAAAKLLHARLHTQATGGGADHRHGTVDLANGERVAYDRHLLVGSELGHDRGTAFAGFLRQITELGGTYEVLAQRQDGSPQKVLMRCDDQLVVVAVLQW